MVVQTLVMVVAFWIGRSREGRKDTQKINPKLTPLFKGNFFQFPCNTSSHIKEVLREYVVCLSNIECMLPRSKEPFMFG